MVSTSHFFSVFRTVCAGLCLSVTALPAAAADEKAKAQIPNGEKVVCKRIEETGSLVKKTKVCLTRAQWTRSAENHERHARDLADGLRTKPSGQ